MIPVGDESHPHGGLLPIVNLSIIAINLAVFILAQLPSDAFTMAYSAIPREILTGTDLVGPAPILLPDGRVETIEHAPGPSPIFLTLVTSIFMHGGWAHLLGNMLFLYVFGDNVEAAFGSLVYLGFYVVTGVLASLAHVLTNASSIIPSLGASGAISGVLAGYLVLFPQNRVRVLVLMRFIPFTYSVPAIVMIGLWALFQFINGFAAITPSEETSGVAYMAHIGGFLAGFVLTLLAKPFANTGRRFAV
ncbi:MAG: rhomboid family intramembrane serine protease [Chloroflexi bacterium]|nr:rhomboid family intramembrane serine protease [Chloroflexota bacterium]